ncbi:MAG: 16S rRNA (cytosine(1402)-N(4))-methyltransferase RsmH [Negativicutes bacterium]|nr:16S rRNA (cytosine(1402)-N(4))-methyltransferase RsmH [Negativicutes bacterium]
MTGDGRRFSHQPVLLAEVLAGLKVRPEGWYIDATAGGGGHAQAILAGLGPAGRLLLIDRDRQALAACRQRLGSDDRLCFRQANFSRLREVAAAAGFEQVDGILLDLGVSSPQLDLAERGFSYWQDGPLDMRMDETQALTAAEIVNRWPEEELNRIVAAYGEERFARRIVARIVGYRVRQPIRTTVQLAELIKAAIPAATRRQGGHPARRTFQALRMAVNNELAELESILPQCVELLRPGGRLCVITFHSLEDRLVKRFVAAEAKRCQCPPDFPVCICRNRPRLRMIGGGSPPLPEERAVNPRARSARLRVAEREE